MGRLSKEGERAMHLSGKAKGGFPVRKVDVGEVERTFAWEPLREPKGMAEARQRAHAYHEQPGFTDQLHAAK